jgi:signal transduction histidine kinase
MGKPLSFRVSSGLKDIIGRDLITDENIAVFELVKNAYDAHATKVEIDFLNIDNEDATIIIKDNGKGMNYSDLKDKWLFVAYSAKKEGTEDNDYRSKIYQDRPFAGAKGIGRFSCDRLGKRLKIESIKDEKNSRKEILEIDWEKFEKRLKEEFTRIPVGHTFTKKLSTDKHGSTLIISDLRSHWNTEKLLSLRKALSKLINPESSLDSKKFVIKINAPGEEERDQRVEDYERVNGEVKNFIFEDLEIRTSKIVVQVADAGDIITTELKDGGTLIYKIQEKNPYKDFLKGISFKVFYLNKAAKSIFKRRMGVGTIDYGSIFVYKDNIRIFPYGEPDDDSFNLNKRKAQKNSIYLGSKDLIGRIEITGKGNEEFKETSSRGDGFIRNETYRNFYDLLLEFVIKRLERYVIDVQKWGGAYISIEDEDLGDTRAELKNRITSLISKISNSSEIVDFEYDNDILNILDDKQSESAIALVNNLFKIAKDTNNKKLMRVAENTKSRVEQLTKALGEAQKDADEKQKALEEQVTENLFLKSIKSQDFDEIVSFMHSIGISASSIDNHLSSTYQKINRGIDINQQKLKEIIQIISFENRKILSISRFATKANFKLFAEENNVNLVEFISEYAVNILKPLRQEDIKIHLAGFDKISFTRTIKPIEISILLDNLISNSIRAKARNFSLIFSINNEKNLVLKVIDDGIGIPNENINKIFDFGFTTTSGSGLGLFHIRQVLGKMNSSIVVTKNIPKGAEFTITFK